MYKTYNIYSVRLSIYNHLVKTYYLPRIWTIKWDVCRRLIFTSWAGVCLRIEIPNCIAQRRFNKSVDEHFASLGGVGGVKREDKLTFREIFRMKVIVSRIKYKNSEMLGSNGWAIGLFRIWTMFLRKKRNSN